MSSIAWMVWALCSAVAMQITSNPIALAIAGAGMLFLVARLSVDRGPVALMLKVGLFMIVIRVVLFGLAGHTSGPIIVTLPQISLPSLLGGFTLGGAISANVVLTSAIEGARLAAVLLCFGVFLSVVEPARVVRLVPSFLFEAGLIVAIAVTFVPSLVRTARDVKEAQQMRGHRSRGPRLAASIALPVLSTTIERSSWIAESMESRGFGFGTRTRYRRERLHASDIAVMTIALVHVSLVLAFAQRFSYSGTLLRVPTVDGIGVGIAALIAAPAFVQDFVQARLRRLSARALESELA